MPLGILLRIALRMLGIPLRYLKIEKGFPEDAPKEFPQMSLRMYFKMSLRIYLMISLGCP